MISGKRCTVDVAGVGSNATPPLASTPTKVRSNLSQGFVEGIKLHDAASIEGNAIHKSIPTIHKGRLFHTPFNLITNECCEGSLCHDLVIIMSFQWISCCDCGANTRSSYDTIIRFLIRLDFLSVHITCSVCSRHLFCWMEVLVINKSRDFLTETPFSLITRGTRTPCPFSTTGMFHSFGEQTNGPRLL